MSPARTAGVLGGGVDPVRTGSLVVPGLQFRSERGVGADLEGAAGVAGACTPRSGTMHVVAVRAAGAGSPRLFAVFVLFSGGGAESGPVLSTSTWSGEATSVPQSPTGR